MCDDCQDWVSLHTHTDISIDGLGALDNLVANAAMKKFSALGITEHGSLGSSVAFIESCKRNNIKPIIGLEGYLELAGETHHITLLANGNNGFNSLVKLNNLGMKSENRKPAFKYEDLLRHNEDVILLTGCPASPMQELDWSDARKIALELKRVFDKRMFAEMMFVSVSDTQNIERSIQLSKDIGIPIITTNDVHFAEKNQAKAHRIVSQVRMGFQYDSDMLFLATGQELRDRVKGLYPEHLKYLNVGMQNSLALANKINAVSFSSTPKLPEIKDAELKFRQAVLEGFHKKFGDETSAKFKVEWERASYEMDIISSRGYATYFLIMKDIIDYSTSIDVKVGHGRGSAAGSLVSYLLDITKINPLEFGLYFERFLNPKRAAMPDIDTDVDSEGRDLVLEYISKKYDGVPIATYSRFSHKSLVRDLARNFHLPKSTEDLLADGDEHSKVFEDVCRTTSGFKEAYDAMLGQIRHIGQHAGGVIITDYAVPYQRNKEGGMMAAWSEGQHADLSAAGIVKFDILGLSACTTLKRLKRITGVDAPKAVDGAPEFDLFKQGKTLGIFQFSGSDGIVQFTKQAKPNSLEQLSIINALYRPGTLNSGTAEKYLTLTSPRKIHPLVDPILETTKGLIIFQEDFMNIYALVTGQKLEDSDIARKALTKYKPGNPKSEEELAQLQIAFFDGCDSHGISRSTANLLWGEIKTHTGYSFNKSHSVAYSHIAWDMAWYKAHYPTHFYAEMLNSDSENAQKYIFEIVAEGIEIVPPHVNHSQIEWSSDGKKIYAPLSAIKHLGMSGVEAIISHRPYKSIPDFMERVPKAEVKSRARLGLFEMDAFSDLEGIIEDLELKEYPVLTPKKKAKMSPKEIQDFEDAKISKRMMLSREEKEREYLGVIIPTITRMKEVTKYLQKANRTAGIILSREVRQSKAGYGDYTVYQITPGRSVWSRDFTNLPEGSWIVAEYLPSSGKIKKYELI